MTPSVVVVHLDESCLGNGREGANPGGAGGLIEIRTTQGVQRRDIYLHDPDTTNNRMAIAGAIVTLKALSAKGERFRVAIVSDSQYLVRGMREWVPSWRARGWKRKGGPVENLSLWQELVDAASRHDVQWTWVRGHKGHVKNEYSNDLAVQAATEQHSSDGAIPSGFPAWLAEHTAKNRYLEYDPDEAFAVLEHELATGSPLPLRMVG
jgi:ribonuclease HI